MLRARFTGVVGTIIAGIAVPALAQNTASAHRIDGTFSDLAWEGAAVVRGFVQRDPREGAPATLPTEVRIVYDTANVYVAVRAFDPEPSRLVGFLTRRDARTSSDWIRVLIDSYHDRRTAYEFAVNPAGREAGRLLVQRRHLRRQLGRDLGRRGLAGHGRLARGVPHPVFATALQRRGGCSARLRGCARGRPAQRDLHVAAPAAQRQRLGLELRRIDRRHGPGFGEAAGAGSLHASRKSSRNRAKPAIRCRTP